LKAIEKGTEARYQTAEMMGEDLRRFLADEPIRARQVSPAERGRRWCRRNPGLAIATSLSVLALVASAVIALSYAVQQGRFARQQTLAAGRELSLRQTSEGLLARVAVKEGVNRCEQSDDNSPFALSPDGRLVSTGGADHRVVLRDPLTFEPLLDFPEWTRTLRDMAFDCASRRLAVVGTDSDLELWNIAALQGGLTDVGLAWDRTTWATASRTVGAPTHRRRP